MVAEKKIKEKTTKNKNYMSISTEYNSNKYD